MIYFEQGKIHNIIGDPGRTETGQKSGQLQRALSGRIAQTVATGKQFAYNFCLRYSPEIARCGKKTLKSFSKNLRTKRRRGVLNPELTVVCQ